MNIHLSIERLILDGLPIDASQRGLVQTAVETELARLFAEGALSPGLLNGGAYPTLAVDAIQLTQGGDPAQIGAQVAQALYGGMGGGRA
jgi:hypothetical protein